MILAFFAEANKIDFENDLRLAYNIYLFYQYNIESKIIEKAKNSKLDGKTIEIILNEYKVIRTLRGLNKNEYIEKEEIWDKISEKLNNLVLNYRNEKISNDIEICYKINSDVEVVFKSCLPQNMFNVNIESLVSKISAFLFPNICPMRDKYADYSLRKLFQGGSEEFFNLTMESVKIFYSNEKVKKIVSLNTGMLKLRFFDKYLWVWAWKNHKPSRYSMVDHDFLINSLACAATELESPSRS